VSWCQKDLRGVAFLPEQFLAQEADEFGLPEVGRDAAERRARDRLFSHRAAVEVDQSAARLHGARPPRTAADRTGYN